MRFYLDFLDALIFVDDLIPNLAINHDKGHLNLIHKYILFKTFSHMCIFQFVISLLTQRHRPPKRI